MSLCFFFFHSFIFLWTEKKIQFFKNTNRGVEQVRPNQLVGVGPKDWCDICIFCRLRSGEELLRDTEQKFLVKIDGLMEELEGARTEAIDARNARDQLQKKCDYFNEQLTKTRVQSQQAVDLIANRSDGGGKGRGFTTRIIRYTRK